MNTTFMRARWTVLLGVLIFWWRSMYAQDIQSVQVVRSETFTQCTTNRPDTQNATTHRLLIDVFPVSRPGPPSIASVAMTAPDGSTPVFKQANGVFFATDDFGNRLKLTNPAPAGKY